MPLTVRFTMVTTDLRYHHILIYFFLFWTGCGDNGILHSPDVVDTVIKWVGKHAWGYTRYERSPSLG